MSWSRGGPSRGSWHFPFAVVFLITTSAGGGQTSDPPDPAAPGEFSSIAGAAASEPVRAHPAADPSHDVGHGQESDDPRVETGLLDTIADSLFGDVYADRRWHSLTPGSFFSEGWFEPWASAPAGRDGLTPRHGWLGAFGGVFYRLWLDVFGYTHHLDASIGGNRYTGTSSIFLPFSRRFEVLFDIPYVVSNCTSDPTRGYRADFGDLTITPRFLLSETVATTQVFALGIRTPTGQAATAGHIMAIRPRYEFWTNPGGSWVVRGGTEVFVPLDTGSAPKGTQTALTGDLAVGRYFRRHDVPFGDLVFYAACNFLAPLEGAADKTYVGVGPGTRFHIANNYFFLNYWEFPVSGPLNFEYTTQVAILKVF